MSFSSFLHYAWCLLIVAINFNNGQYTPLTLLVNKLFSSSFYKTHIGHIQVFIILLYRDCPGQLNLQVKYHGSLCYFFFFKIMKKRGGTTVRPWLMHNEQMPIFG
jgi:hypothetical protein